MYATKLASFTKSIRFLLEAAATAGSSNRGSSAFYVGVNKIAKVTPESVLKAVDDLLGYTEPVCDEQLDVAGRVEAIKAEIYHRVHAEYYSIAVEQFNCECGFGTANIHCTVCVPFRLLFSCTNQSGIDYFSCSKCGYNIRRATEFAHLPDVLLVNLNFKFRFLDLQTLNGALTCESGGKTYRLIAILCMTLTGFLCSYSLHNQKIVRCNWQGSYQVYDVGSEPIYLAEYVLV